MTVWCGNCSEDVISPYVFKNGDGGALTVNGECYRQISNELFFFTAFHLDRCLVSTEQSSRSHSSSIYGEFETPVSRSSDLSFWSFQLAVQIARSNTARLLPLGFLESRLYSIKPKTLLDFKLTLKKKSPIWSQLLCEQQLKMP